MPQGHKHCDDAGKREALILYAETVCGQYQRRSDKQRIAEAGNWGHPEATPSSIRSHRESDHRMLIDAGSQANSMAAASLP